jgi:hypothetical protein
MNWTLSIPHLGVRFDQSLRRFLELHAARLAIFLSTTISERPCMGFTPRETLGLIYIS